MTDSPSGIDLHPTPANPPRMSRRALVLVLVILAVIVLILAYGLHARNQRTLAEAQLREPTIEPASSHEVLKAVPPAQAAAPLTPPPAAAMPATPQLPNYPPPRLPPFPREIEPPVFPVQREPTPEERAAERMRQAMLAPTTMQADAPQPSGVAPFARAHEAAGVPPRYAATPEAALVPDEYMQANFQDRKQAFLRDHRALNASNYLLRTREPQISAYEIKAGWDIPAVLEQEINSDLPGEVKALVTQAVYDTATGQYLLIPQGARLIGRYNSEVSSGQDGVQAIWDRIIFPDGSSVNLDGMTGMDAKGNAGLRHKVDRHFWQTFKGAFLVSAFVAAFELTQRRQYGAFQQPGAGDRAVGAMGGEMSNVGAQMARRNLNNQPTIKVPVGYRFTVRVNKDMLFSEPYRDTSAPTAGKPEVMRTRR